MPVYNNRRTAYTYGHAIGILLLDAHAPFIPGDVGNACTYNYPVLYKVVPGLTTSLILKGAPELTERVVKAARELEEQGVRGISSDCGFFLQFQDVVRNSVNIPVALSSLLQLPFIAQTIKPTRPIGVITADSGNLTMDFLANAGISVENPLIIRGLQNEPEFKTAALEEKDTLDSDLFTKEVLNAAHEMLKDNSDIGLILLECSLLPPYSKAVQDATGLPVYDFITMIDYMQSGTHQISYSGYM